MLMVLGDNNLSFIETSALDASNVELAFQNILTGIYPSHSSASITAAYQTTEIFRIVSSKALDSGDSAQNPLSDRKVVEITKTQDPESKQGCC